MTESKDAQRVSANQRTSVSEEMRQTMLKDADRKYGVPAERIKRLI